MPRHTTQSCINTITMNDDSMNPIYYEKKNKDEIDDIVEYE